MLRLMLFLLSLLLLSMGSACHHQTGTEESEPKETALYCQDISRWIGDTITLGDTIPENTDCYKLFTSLEIDKQLDLLEKQDLQSAKGSAFFQLIIQVIAKDWEKAGLQSRYHWTQFANNRERVRDNPPYLLTPNGARIKKLVDSLYKSYSGEPIPAVFSAPVFVFAWDEKMAGTYLEHTNLTRSISQDRYFKDEGQNSSSSSR